MRLHVWKMAIQERIGNPFIDKSSYVLSKQGLILIWLVVTGTWIDHFSRHIGNFIIPTDFHSIIFQRGRRKTTNQSLLVKRCSPTRPGIYLGMVHWYDRSPLVMTKGMVCCFINTTDLYKHFFIFHNIWDNPSHLTFIFFRGVETTNQWLFFFKALRCNLSTCHETRLEFNFCAWF